MSNYWPQRSCGQGYVFTRVCDSVHRGGLPEGGTPQKEAPPGRRPPQKEAPLEGDPPKKEASKENPQKETPSGWRHPRHTVNERLVRILLECILVVSADHVTCHA